MAAPAPEAREVRRSRRHAEREWVTHAPAPPPGTLAVVSLRGLLGGRVYDSRGRRVYDAAAQAARALLREGAFVLELSPSDAAALSETLGASAVLFAPRNAGCATQLLGGKALVEYRRGGGGADESAARALPARVRSCAEGSHALLTAAGRAVLRALSSTYEAHDVAYPMAAPIRELDALLEPADAHGGARRSAAAASASVLTFLHYGDGAEAAPHTDRGLLTLAYAAQAGLEVRLRGAAADAWTAPPVAAHTLVVFAGECLQLATGNAVRAVVHRVAPGAARRSLVMRLRANPDAALPLTFGPYWRCATVRAFNDRFTATHSSVNEPVRTLAPAAPAAVAVAGAGASSAAAARASPAEAVLATADLAAAIVRFLGDDAAALARVELVCVSLRDAVAPHWRRMCVALSAGAGTNWRGALRVPLPRCIVAADARQWRTLHRCMTGLMLLRVKDQESCVVQLRVRANMRWRKLADAYCLRKELCRDDVRFLLDGQRVSEEATPYELRIEDGHAVDAMMAQVGD
jgi:small ubiquitin-related modifier